MKRYTYMRPAEAGGLANQFVRGFIAVGLLTAIQDRRGIGAPSSRLVARRAVQGGAARAAGVAAAAALSRREYGTAVLSAALGAAAVAAAEYLLNEKEPSNGKASEESVQGST
jgi:hypothetical protein